MSFVPAPQQANAASGKSNAPNVTSTQTASAAAEAPLSDQDILFKTRTYDVFWVEKKVRPSTVPMFATTRASRWKGLLLHAMALIAPVSSRGNMSTDFYCSFHSLCLSACLFRRSCTKMVSQR